MSVHLPEQWKGWLEAIFAQLAPQFDVWAYGSRVTGLCHNGSDLDLVLIHPTTPDKRCDTLPNIREALEASLVPICVDVMDWASVPPEFHRQMNQQRLLLFKAHSPLGHPDENTCD
jgi:predicted nucleotidyltransferase